MSADSIVEAYHSKVWYEGWLVKEGRLVKNWKRRYFVLKGGKLLYYKNDSKNEADLKGQMDIEGCEARYIGQRTDEESNNMNSETNEEETSDDESSFGSRGSFAVSTSSPSLKTEKKATTDPSRFRYKFCVEGADRDLFMAAETMEITKEWIVALKNCINVENYFKDCKNHDSPPLLSAVRVLSDNTCKSLAVEDTALTNNNVKALVDMLKRNKILTKLILKNAELTDSFMTPLASAFAHNEVLRTLDLSNNRIGDEGVGDMADGLYLNININSLSLSRNVFGDIGAVHLSDLLKGNVSLVKVDISYNAIGSKGAKALANALESNNLLKELEMGSNNIGDEGAICLAEGLKHNKTLEKFGISYNKIGSEGMKALCIEGLVNNRCIKDIDLVGNEFDKNGASALVQALKDHKTLTRVDLGNNKKLGVNGITAMAEVLKSRFLVSNLVMTRIQKK